MSLFSNEQKHRKINKKNQGSCLDLANKGFFFAITESRDKDYYNSAPHPKAPQTGGCDSTPQPSLH